MSGGISISRVVRKCSVRHRNCVEGVSALGTCCSPCAACRPHSHVSRAPRFPAVHACPPLTHPSARLTGLCQAGGGERAVLSPGDAGEAGRTGDR